MQGAEGHSSYGNEHGDATGNVKTIQQRPVEEGDVCPICQCDLLDDDLPYIYCHQGVCVCVYVYVHE